MFRSIISLVVSFAIFLSSGIASIFAKGESLRLVVPENWEMQVGDSRTLECVFGNKVTDRVIDWSVTPSDVASVDEWGRVTALRTGEATITAKTSSLTDSVTLRVTSTPTKVDMKTTKKDYEKDAVKQVENLQKIVTRYPVGSEEVPFYVRVTSDYSKYQSVTTADGALWQITEYGVLRTDENAPTERDREQRFMGDRYFYSADTTDGKVLAIFSDKGNGIWTVMEKGYTHINLVPMSGDEKAILMSDETQEKVERRGFVSNSYLQGDGSWRKEATDNDGLWTAMYGAGELMRYAVLRDDPSSSEEEVAKAREIATKSAEAILMLHYISMRKGTTDAYVRYHHNGKMPGDAVDRWLSAEALKEGGNYSYLSPEESPAELFEKNYANLLFTGNTYKIMNVDFNIPVDPDSWASTRDEANKDVKFAKKKRLVEGFVARTYWIESEESHGLYDNIYWQVNEDHTATGVSTKAPTTQGYYLNNENLRGVTVDASGEIPERLWNSLVGSDVLKSDVIYKGDTSADELIGHAFILKLMYDILGDEDKELKELMVTAIDNLAQHLVDNGYMLVDGSGQPTTWSNFSRTTFNTSSAVPMAPLHAMVILSIFKTAAYMTGYEKWENEYRLAALDPAYEYAKIVSQESDRLLAAVSNVVGEAVSPLLSLPLKLLSGTKLYNLISRIVGNDSDLEMAMLGFYTLFQTEDDEEILSLYKKGLDAWWEIASYTENPLWYYIYQLAYPDKEIKDSYNNNILETASWSLSRHPVSTMRYLASNNKRDDITQLDLSPLGITDMWRTPTYSLKGKGPAEVSENPEILDYVKFVLSANGIKWAVAAPDERSMHKYNENSYLLTAYHQSNLMEGSTTYTLPYWMGRYHGILDK
ncbi:MAG: Ig-like domain-containing protein [Clostridia bacterium]|nr:Ig-like domain-containing protein [Clostridia bacterium]